jgi:molybdopterin-guanine dinucleotide biosynthesis protein A
MGKDKAFLIMGGQTLLRRALALARTVAREVRIVGSREKFESFGSVVEDVFTDCGPLAGIHAALRATTSDLNLVLAVDLPFLTPEFLSYVVEAAKQSKSPATVALTGSNWQSLCGVYRKEFADVAENALREGKLRLDSLLATANASVIGEGELSRAGFSTEMFRNINTAEEFAEAERQLAKEI